MTIARSELSRHSLEGIATGRRLDPVYPGAVLSAEFMEPLGLIRSRVAETIAPQQRRVDEICSGVRAVTADTAVRLGLAFAVEPQFWLNLQSQYDLEVIQREQGARLSELVQPLAA